MRVDITKVLDALILGLMAYLAHQTIFVWFVEYSQYGGSPQLQLGILLILVLLVFWRLRFEKLEKDYWIAWRYNWLVAVFIVLAGLSMAWSVSIPATMYRFFLALFSSLIAAYFGIRFSARNLVNYIAIIIGILGVASFFVIVFFPRVGISTDPAYFGLWQGIFWHKIYLGASMALGYISYLVILFSSGRQYNRLQKSLAAILILLCCFLAIKSDSASGLVTIVLQSILFVLLFAWLKWGHNISRRVYWFSGAVLFSAILFVLANLKFVFGLFNRSANLTGRVPMWSHLVNDYILKRPFFGYGFGAFWIQPGIMEKIQSLVSWLYPVRVSDNGYLDIALGLGLIGLFLLLTLLALIFWRALRHGIKAHELTSFFPFFVLTHIVLINISLSYFFEGEFFIWFLLIIILFMLTPNGNKPVD